MKAFPSKARGVLCAVIAMLFVQGCSLTGKRSENAIRTELDPESIRLFTPAYFQLKDGASRHALRCLMLPADSADMDLLSGGDNRDLRLRMWFKALSAPVVEKPEYWVETINDRTRSDLLRVYAFQSFFLRHVKPGDSFRSLTKIPGTKVWFNEKSTWLLGGLGGKPPFHWEDWIQEDVDFVYLALELGDAKLSVPVTLAVRGFSVDPLLGYDDQNAELIRVIRDEHLSSKLTIIGISIY